SATNRLLNTLRPPTALTRQAAAELNQLLEAHGSEGAANCMEAEGLSLPIQAGMPRKAVARALARHWGQEYVDAEEVEFPRDCKWALKEAFVREHCVVCYEVQEDAVRIAIPHPFMRDVAEQVAGLTGKAVHVAISARQDIKNRLDKLWPAM
ncbi:MAG: GspE/PulE/PilB domain-containing protein, partial [Candidatus Xenobia bacterium]